MHTRRTDLPPKHNRLPQSSLNNLRRTGGMEGGQHVGEDVAVVAAAEVEDGAEAETLATQRRMDRHPRHTTTIPERGGPIKGTGP